MSDVDTSRHTLTGVRLSIQLELENMPAVKVHYGTTEMIASQALVFFQFTESGTVEWVRMELTGSMPNKAGAPSKRHNSDSYSTGRTPWAPERDPYFDVPAPYMAVIATAGEVVKAMLR